MNKVALIILMAILPLKIFTQCYKQLSGSGIHFYSPLKYRVTLYKKIPQKKFGDVDSSARLCLNKFYKKIVSPSYIVPANEPIYATHTGIIHIFTSGVSNEANDACWLDGGAFSTVYFDMYFTVANEEFIYAGQKIGNAKAIQDTSTIAFGIRMAPPIQPLMKRGVLPEAGIDTCSCFIDPIFPEYFVNPDDLRILWDYNDVPPTVSLKIETNPSWVGRWSFDNGKTWFRSGQQIDGLPVKLYNIIFKDTAGWEAPLPLIFKASSSASQYYTKLDYKPIVNSAQTILPNIDLTDSLKIDSLKKIAYDSGYENSKNSLITSFQDTLKKRIANVEKEQKNSELKNNRLMILYPALFFLVLFLILIYQQYKRIRKEKNKVETLQKELHHRVRTNLGIIASLIDTTSREMGGNKVLKELEGRINSISFVHEQLYKQKDISKLILQDFLEKIAMSISESYGEFKKIEININAYLKVENELSTQIALIVNELITNSCKYAFTDVEKGIIDVKAVVIANKIRLTVKDNGAGFPEGFIAENQTTFGIQMIIGLINQKRGLVKFYNENGAVCEIDI